MDRLTVYLSHANSVDFLLDEDGAGYDLSAATKLTLTIGDVLVESTDNVAGPIRWAGALQQGEVNLVLGEEAIPEGDYDCPLVIYQPATLSGEVWDEFVPLHVEPEVEGT